jgi:hypothetical protein
MAKSVMFSLTKGFLYGTVIGLIFGTTIFILASAVIGLGFIVDITAIQLASIIFGAGMVSGVAKEYADWLDTPETPTTFDIGENLTEALKEMAKKKTETPST